MDDNFPNFPGELESSGGMDDDLQSRVEAALGLTTAAKPGPTLTPAKRAEQEMAQQAELLKASIDMLLDVTLQLTVELGRTNMTVSQVIDLQKGSVIELNRVAGEAVDVFVNDRMLARGEVVVVDDKFGVRITELLPPIPKRDEVKRG
jgi:flagellar motor switch protein FliN/FliY